MPPKPSTRSRVAFSAAAAASVAAETQPDIEMTDAPDERPEATQEPAPQPLQSIPTEHPSSSTAPMPRERPAPAQRGVRASKLKFQPKAVERLTREQKEDLERSEVQRERERRRAAERAAGYRGGFGGRARGEDGRGRGEGRQRGGFRGGMSGWRAPVDSGGHLSGPRAKEKREVAPGGRGSGALGTRGKEKEEGDHVSRSSGGGSGSSGGGGGGGAGQGGSGKTSGGGRGGGSSGTGTGTSSRNKQIIQSADQPRGGPAGNNVAGFNIEQIHVISDDEDDDDDDPMETSDPSKGSKKAADRMLPGTNLRPIRLDRDDHKDRKVKVKVDPDKTSTSSTSTSNPRPVPKVKEKPDEGPDAAAIPNADPPVAIKVEDDSDAPVPNEAVRRASRRQKTAAAKRAIIELSATPEPPPAPAPLSVQPGAVDRAHELKGADSLTGAAEPRPPTTRRPPKPVLQTQEDRDEWARYQRDLQDVRDELARLDVDAKPAGGAADGDAAMADACEAASDRRNELTYLFQLPPLIPALRAGAAATPAPAPAPAVDGDAIEEVAGPTASSPQPKRKKTAAAAAAAAGASSPAAKVKPDPEIKPEASSPSSGDGGDGPSEAGYVGALLVFESGEAALDWAGVPFVLSKGGDNQMLQEVLLADALGLGAGRGAGRESAVKREQGEEGGLQQQMTAWSMGQLTGGFVVTPDWERFFE